MTNPQISSSMPPPFWAHQSGVLKLGHLVPSDWRPEALAARAQIADVFNRFAISHDEARIHPLISCFTADAVYQVAQASGEPFLQYRGREEMTLLIAGFIEAQGDQRRHIVGNILVDELDIDGGTASAIAYSVVTIASDGIFVGSSVIYSTRLRREFDGCWRFSHFFIGMDTFTTERGKSDSTI